MAGMAGNESRAMQIQYMGNVESQSQGGKRGEQGY